MYVAEEGLEHQQRPYRRAVVADAARMLVQQALNEAHVKESDVLERALRQTYSGRFAQGSPKPTRQWNGEAHFLSVENVVGQPAFHGLLQQILALTRFQAEGRWQCRHPFEQGMIEQRNANLERSGHARSIDFGQD